jgi:hypothetical protein
MLEAFLLLCSSACIIFLVNSNIKLQKKITKYEFDIFMKSMDTELTSQTKEDYTIVERILQ